MYFDYTLLSFTWSVNWLLWLHHGTISKQKAKGSDSTFSDYVQLSGIHYTYMCETHIGKMKNNYNAVDMQTFACILLMI